MIKRGAFVILLVLFTSKRTEGFLWDQFNIERLFQNSEQVFGTLTVRPEERECVRHFKTFVDDLKRRQSWALKVIDSWAKEPAGLYSDVEVDFGHFDQCIAQSDVFARQHCQLEVENDRNNSYRFGICVPRVCEDETIVKVMRPFFSNVDWNATEVELCMDRSNTGFGVTQGLTVGLYVLFVGLVVYATVRELRRKKGMLLGCSLVRNTMRLLDQTTDFGAMSCLNGLRVLMMTMVVIDHSFEFYMLLADNINKSEFNEVRKSFPKIFTRGGEYAVDAFFVMGALLVTYSFMKARARKESFNFPKYVLHRYLRLMPVWAVVALFFVAFTQFFKNGPMHPWAMGYEVESCEKFWWSGLLMVQNYVNPQEMCIESAWYVSVDFQLYLLSPLLLFPLFKFGKKVFLVMAVLTVSSVVSIFITSYHYDIHFADTPHDTYWDWVYFPTHGRVGPWLIGMGLGYILYETKDRQISIPKALNVTLWVLSLGFPVILYFIAYYNLQKENEAVLTFALFVSLTHVIWALAVAWIIFSCVKGHGGLINKFLALPSFQPYAKLSYAVYIVHYPIIIQLASMQQTLVTYNSFIYFHSFLGTFLLSSMLAVVLFLFIEMPVATLESGMYKKLEGKKKEENLPQKPTA